MGLKDLSIGGDAKAKPTNPIDIFNALTLRGSVKNIWQPQADALREWHNKREAADSVIQMNTGGGKTLVGLMIAQSLLNELNRRVLYIVPTNQLVEQTLSKARDLGLQPAARYDGQWNKKTEYETADTFCITNYASVFTGRSVFREGDIAATIFDDAHVAEGIIRDQYTVKISSRTTPYRQLLNLLRPFFTNTSGATKLADIERGRPQPLLFIPTYISHSRANQIRQILSNAETRDIPDLAFSWTHIQDNISQCCILIASNRIEITPPSLPLHRLPFFSPERRRVYLTATLPSEVSLARTFGVVSPNVIRPQGKSGDAQRLFVFADGDSDEQQRAHSLRLVSQYKACVISPSSDKAREWAPNAEMFNGDNGQQQIERFAQTKSPIILALVARYDGIDLAGDTCRILIMDRLPRGESFYDRFIDEGVRIEAIRESHFATRIIQGIGRIFRSNTDHGAVILVGNDLQSWIRNPANRIHFPELMQKQVGLGIELTKQVATKRTNWPELLEGILQGSTDWDDLYNRSISKMSSETRDTAESWYPPLLISERVAFAAMWDGNASAAAASFEKAAQQSEQFDPRLAAWYRHLAGLACLQAGARKDAFAFFAMASRTRAELGCPEMEEDRLFKPGKVDNTGLQARALARTYLERRDWCLNQIEECIGKLEYGPETKSTEVAMQNLGILLGLESSRPDSSHGTGPDNLWHLPTSTAWGFELKTGKQPDSEYSKTDIGQCHDHLNGIRERQLSVTNCITVVGRELQVAANANPDPRITVIGIEACCELARIVKVMWVAVDAGDKENLADAFQAWLTHFNLLWPNCVQRLDSRLLIDLRGE